MLQARIRKPAPSPHGELFINDFGKHPSINYFFGHFGCKQRLREAGNDRIDTLSRDSRMVLKAGATWTVCRLFGRVDL
jgi:hypothetical protein